VVHVDRPHWDWGGGSSSLLDVSCPSASLCAAIDVYGNVLTSTRPTGGRGAWKRTRLQDASPDTIAVLNAISCPVVSLCVAVNGSGDVFTATNPTGGPGAWRREHVDRGEENALNDVSCASQALCVAVDGDGRAIASIDPSEGRGAWRVTAVRKLTRLSGMSCVARSLCVALDGSNSLLISRRPAAGPRAWQRADPHSEPSDPSTFLSSVSCPSSSLCFAGRRHRVRGHLGQACVR
jgi:hypothetical protein